MQFPIIKKKCFEVKLILNKKDEFKLIHQKLVIRICFSNSPIHKEHSFQFTSLHRKLPYTENLSYNILSHNSEVGGVPGFSYLYPTTQDIGPVTKVIR